MQLDTEYVRSETFIANVTQALRAAEIADCEDKLKIIAKSLLGCALNNYLDNSLKTIYMRIVEQISYPEIRMLIYIGDFTHKRKLDGGSGGMSETEIDIFDSAKNATLCRSLLQLGLLKDKTNGTRVIHESHVWTLSSLAHDIIELCTAVDDIEHK